MCESPKNLKGSRAINTTLTLNGQSIGDFDTDKDHISVFGDMEESTPSAKLSNATQIAHRHRSISTYFNLQLALRAAVVSGVGPSTSEAAAAREVIADLQQSSTDASLRKTPQSDPARYILDIHDVISHSDQNVVLGAYDRITRDSLVIKLMSDGSDFERESERYRLNTEENVVKAAVRIRSIVDSNHLALLLGRLSNNLIHNTTLTKGIIMDRADKSLFSMLTNTNIAKFDFNSCMHAFIGVALCLSLMHSSKLIHGNLSSRHIVRIRRHALTTTKHSSNVCFFEFKLCALTSQVRFGERIIRRHAHEIRVHDPPEIVQHFSSESQPSQFPISHPSQDMWALGCILYQLATGRPLFQALSWNCENLSCNAQGISQVLNWSGISPQDERSIFYGSNATHTQKMNVRTLLSGLLHRIPTQRLTIMQVFENPLVSEFLPSMPNATSVLSRVVKVAQSAKLKIINTTNSFSSKIDMEFYKVVDNHIATHLKRPNHYQYLTVRNQLCKIMDQHALSAFEKSVLNHKLMLFVPQAVVRMTTFLEKNKAFSQKGLFSVVTSNNHLINGALAQMELCTSRSCVIGDDTAIDIYPPFLDLRMCETQSPKYEQLINVVAGCYKHFFYRMEVPLLDEQISRPLRIYAATNDKQGFLTEVPLLLANIMPPPHLHLLRHTLTILGKVLDNCDIKKMGSNTLARSFVKCLFHYPKHMNGKQADEEHAAQNQRDDEQEWILNVLITEQKMILNATDGIVAQKLHNNSENISQCCDYVNSCCHDSNRWRFFFPLKAKESKQDSESKKQIYQRKLVENQILQRLSAKFNDFVSIQNNK